MGYCLSSDVWDHEQWECTVRRLQHLTAVTMHASGLLILTKAFFPLVPGPFCQRLSSRSSMDSQNCMMACHYSRIMPPPGRVHMQTACSSFQPCLWHSGSHSSKSKHHSSTYHTPRHRPRNSLCCRLLHDTAIKYVHVPSDFSSVRCSASHMQQPVNTQHCTATYLQVSVVGGCHCTLLKCCMCNDTVNDQWVLTGNCCQQTCISNHKSAPASPIVGSLQMLSSLLAFPPGSQHP